MNISLTILERLHLPLESCFYIQNILLPLLNRGILIPRCYGKEYRNTTGVTNGDEWSDKSVC